MDLEHPLIKVPYECLNKTVRSTQKMIEKELGAVDKALSDVRKKEMSNEDACKSIDKIVNRLRGVKRKIDEAGKEEQHQVALCKARIDHLKTVPQKGSPDEQIEKRIWNKNLLNRILVDYLMRSGYYEAATTLADSTGIRDLVDIDIFIKSRQVVEGLMRGDCKEALAWCSENKSKLRKLKSTLEFNLRMQEFLELVRQDKLQDAIQYARKHLSAAHETNMPEIRRAMATLAFRKDTKVSPYKELFDKSRWNDLIQQFKHDNYLLHSLTTEPLLHITLQAGLLALKTPQAYDPETYNVNDPLCSPKFQILAENLPYAYHGHTKLVCRITGEVMNEDNYPMALPNGNAYSRKALEDMASKNGGWVTDPRTGQKFRFEELRKVFIM